MDENVFNNALKIIEGTFDGENMWGEDMKIYPVSPNYVSKSKLLEGDRLKLYLQQDGRFIFKQTKPVERKRVVALITSKLEAVTSEGGCYKICPASVTFYKASPGDEAVIILPVYGNSTWAALENIIKIPPQEIEL